MTILVFQLDEAQALTQLLETAEHSDESGLHVSGEAVSTIADQFIALIEGRTFIRECIRRSMQSAFPLQIHTFSQAIELQQKCHKLPKLILFSAKEDDKEANGERLQDSLRNRAEEYQSLSLPTTTTPKWPWPPFVTAQRVTSQ